MARRPSDIVQPNLRIREDLRRRLEREAKRRGVSLNQEMTYRLQRSFEQDAVGTIGSVAADIEANWLRFAAAHHEANMLGDLVRAAEALLKQLDTGNSVAIGKAAEKVRAKVAMIDAAAAAAVRTMHTTGEDA